MPFGLVGTLTGKGELGTGVSAPLAAFTEYTETLGDPPRCALFATYTKRPRGSALTDAGELPVRVTEVCARAPVGSMRYTATVSDDWLVTYAKRFS
jgi:hypothetical protein